MCLRFQFCTHQHTQIYIAIYVCLYVCLYVCMLNCIYVCMYVCIYVCMYVLYIILHFTSHNREPSQCRGRTMVLYAGGARFKSPVCTRSFVQVLFYLGGVILQRQKGNFPQHFGICKISHKSYFSREFSHQYMGKFLRNFNLYARMKLLLNKHT